jgi:hypothetical protein
MNNFCIIPAHAIKRLTGKTIEILSKDMEFNNYEKL